MKRLAHRRATLDDLPALREIERGSFGEPWPETSLRGELERPCGRMWIAASGTAAAGYACFLAAGGEAELLRIAVVPELRRHGVGRGLLRHGLAALRTEGVTSCFLEVRAGDPGAVAFYRELGFVEAGRRSRYYADGGDALLYRRRLADP